MFLWLIPMTDTPSSLERKKGRGEKEKWKRYYQLYGKINWNGTWAESYVASSKADIHYIILAITGAKLDDLGRPLQSYVTLISWTNYELKVFFLDCQIKIHCHCTTEHFKSDFKNVPLSLTSVETSWISSTEFIFVLYSKDFSNIQEE